VTSILSASLSEYHPITNPHRSCDYCRATLVSIAPAGCKHVNTSIEHDATVPFVSGDLNRRMHLNPRIQCSPRRNICHLPSVSLPRVNPLADPILQILSVERYKAEDDLAGIRDHPKVGESVQEIQSDNDEPVSDSYPMLESFDEDDRESAPLPYYPPTHNPQARYDYEWWSPAWESLNGMLGFGGFSP
jgi:hypothetical protein